MGFNAVFHRQSINQIIQRKTKGCLYDIIDEDLYSHKLPRDIHLAFRNHLMSWFYPEDGRKNPATLIYLEKLWQCNFGDTPHPKYLRLAIKQWSLKKDNGVKFKGKTERKVMDAHNVKVVRDFIVNALFFGKTLERSCELAAVYCEICGINNKASSIEKRFTNNLKKFGFLVLKEQLNILSTVRNAGKCCLIPSGFYIPEFESWCRRGHPCPEWWSNFLTDIENKRTFIKRNSYKWMRIKGERR